MNYQFSRIDSPDLVDVILSRPHIKRVCGDDFLLQFMPNGAAQALINSPLVELFGVESGGDFYGMYIIERKSDSAAEVHTCLLQNAFGRAAEISKEFRKFLFDELQWLHVLITQVPVINRLADILARKSGFELCATLANYWRVDGALIDVNLYQMRRG